MTATETKGVQAQWNLVTGQLPAIVWSTDRELQVTSGEGAGLRLVNLTPAQVIGRGVLEAFGPVGVDLVALHRQALKGESVNAEVYWGEHIFHTHVEPLRDEAGAVIGCAGVALDVTAWRQAERALESEEVRLRALIANMPVAVYRCTTGPRRTIEFISDSIERITGHPSADFLHNRVRSFVSIIHKDDRRRVETEMSAALKDRLSFDVEYRIQRADGEVRWLQDRGQGIHDERENLRWIDGVMFDVTERKRTESNLHALNRALETRVAEGGVAAESSALQIVRSREEFQRQTEILQNVLNSIDDGVVVVDLEGRFLLFTPLAEEIVGMGAMPVAPEKWSEAYGIFGEDMVTPFPFDQLPLVRAMRGEECTGVVVFIRNPRVPDGLFLSVTARPWRDAHGVIRGGVAALRNITEQHKAKEAFRASEARLSLLMAQVPTIMWTTDTTMLITSSLGAGLKEVGLQPGQVVGMTLQEYLQTRDESHPLLAAHRKALNGISSTFESVHEDLIFSTRIEPFYDADRRIIGTIGLGQNITERKRSEEALRESEAKNKAVLDALPDLVFRVSKDGVFLDCKTSQPENLYALPEQVIGRHVREALPAEVADRCVQAMERALTTRSPQSIEYQLSVAGESRDYEARLVNSGENEILALVRDITAKKRLEREILEISDREQRRIGQDLHDGLCQHLTGTAFAGKILEQKLAERNLPEAADAREIAELVEQGISQARRLARGLYPTEIEAEGIVSALDHLATTLSDRFGIRCTFEHGSGLTNLDRQQSFHLYRIVQEATNNAIRHGRARCIHIALASQRGGVRLTVSDDGMGFVAPLAKSQGMGLQIMKYRAQMLGGSFDIQRSADGGTTVICTFTHKRESRRREGSNGNRNSKKKQRNPAKSVRGR